MEQLLSSIALLVPTLVFLLQQPPSLMGVAAQTNQLKAGPGSSMTPTSHQNLILSSSGLFAFGFCSLDPSLYPNQFILAIWYDFNARDCTNKSVVWFARDSVSDDAVIATEQYALNFHGDSPLSLINDHQEAVWTPSEKYGSTLVLQESGNLQLFGQPGDGDVADVLWESFVDPTDVLLPGNNITFDPAHPKRQLLSKKTYTDFSSGRFVLVVQNDSNIVMYLRDQESGTGYPYWTTDTDYQGTCVAVLFFNESEIYYNVTNCSYTYNITNGTVVQLEKSYTEGYYKYMALDPDGTVRVYVHPKNNMDGNSWSWDMVRLFPEYDGCTRTGICGPNSYCTRSPDKYQRLNCLCPESYEFLDAHHSYKGCTPNFIPYICDGKDHSSEFKTVEMETTSWSTESTYKKYASPPDPSHQECSTSCLNNCLCAAVLIDNTSCMEVWTLTAGRQESGIAMKSLIKVRQSKPAITRVSSLTTKLLYVTIGVLATVSAVSNLLWQSYVTKKEAKMSMLSGLRSFTYKEIKQATGGFKELLGRGGFGHVFKGELSYMEPPYVAVKMLIRSEFGEKDFNNEVQSIGQIHHKNLARLIGYCKQGMHRVLVFQYMQGGTLADFIFRPERRPCWSCLAEAAIGIARGLEYLHEGCKSQIIHCDIKPDNILFDDIYTPKITDFGIARLLGDQKTQHTITSQGEGAGLAGTKPYAAPEWFDGGGKVDNKVDVYSFGVMLMEMICCRRAADWGQQPNDQGENCTTMRAWVESLVRNGKAELLVQGESEALADMEGVERFARVAIWCLQKEPSARPRMRKVVQMLEGTVEVDPLPPTFSAVLSADGNRSLPHSAIALEID